MKATINYLLTPVQIAHTNEYLLPILLTSKKSAGDQPNSFILWPPCHSPTVNKFSFTQKNQLRKRNTMTNSF